MTDLVHPIDAIAPIDIAALEAEAALLTRTDRKYVVDLDTLDTLLAWVVEADDSMRALEIDGTRWFGYESTYFDTPELRSYHLAARGRPRRFKVRTRAYLDSRLCMIEVKERNARRQTVKHRAPHPFAHRTELTDDAHDFVTGFADLIGPDDVERLEVALTTRYRRATLCAPTTGSRATIDVGLACTTPDGRVTGIGRHAIVETKSTGAPTTLDRALWSLGARTVCISKFATGLAALYPTCPRTSGHACSTATSRAGRGGTGPDRHSGSPRPVPSRR